MAWNEPGGSGNKDPWGSPGNKDQGPPDLDEVIRKFQNKLSGLFGGKGGGTGGSMGGTGGSSAMASVIIVIGFLVWLASGIYIVDEPERGVVTRFGAFADTSQPGPHWHIPFPIEKVEIVNVDKVNSAEIGFRGDINSGRSASTIPQEALMLTQDENIVDVKFAVQYRIKDAKDYLFNVKDPDVTLRHAMESSIREVIGKSTMDFVLTEGQSEMSVNIEKLAQEILDRYTSGLLLTSVNLQSAQPPQEVKDAFDDAIKAREDQERLINEAHAYSNDLLPKARGNAARQLEESNGYKARVVAQAEGEASRFTALLKEYTRAPQVTRQRLYIETIEEVMGNTSKVMLDVKGGNNMVYLPLDKIIGQSQQLTIPGAAQQVPSFAPETNRPSSNDSNRLRDNLRSRGGLR